VNLHRPYLRFFSGGGEFLHPEDHVTATLLTVPQVATIVISDNATEADRRWRWLEWRRKSRRVVVLRAGQTQVPGRELN